MNRINIKQTVSRKQTQNDLQAGIAQTAFAFRGYNQTNLGRTPELLRHPVYGRYVKKYLSMGSEICRQWTDRPVDLVKRVQEGIEPELNEYNEAITMIIAVENAQMEILRNHFDVNDIDANMMYGFSLGELGLLTHLDVMTMQDALSIPLQMCNDVVELANDVQLGILFSRSKSPLPKEDVLRVCAEINLEGNGVIGISTILAPNSMLVMGQGDTMQRLKKRTKDITGEKVSLRLNDGKWPPLHTPIVWQKNISDRAQNLLHTVSLKSGPFDVPVFSLATGAFSYNDSSTRSVLGKWIDQPQLLWEAVDATLLRGIRTVVHVGPQPNIIPSTFDRLASNVLHQTGKHVSLRTLSSLVKQGWLSGILPKRTSLLRAPHVKHVVLEDWLLEQEV